MVAKLSAQDLLAAADELGPEERRVLVDGIRKRPELVSESLASEDLASQSVTRESAARESEDEVVAEAAMASTVRMLDSSRDLIDRVLGAAERVSDELSHGWF